MRKKRNSTKIKTFIIIAVTSEKNDIRHITRKIPLLHSFYDSFLCTNICFVSCFFVGVASNMQNFITVMDAVSGIHTVVSEEGLTDINSDMMRSA